MLKYSLASQLTRGQNLISSTLPGVRRPPLSHHQMAQTTKIANWATKDDTVEFLLIHVFSSFAVPCKTVGDRGLPCVFPFIYENTTYNSCTPRDSDNGQPWFVSAFLTKLNVQKKIVLFLFRLEPGARQQLTRRE